MREESSSRDYVPMIVVEERKQISQQWNAWLKRDIAEGTKLAGAKRSRKGIITTPNGGSKKKACFYCRRVVHFARECKRDKSKIWRDVSERGTKSKKEKTRQKAASAKAVHTEPKRVTLKAERSNPKVEALRIIIDSGASEHVVSDPNLLKREQKIEPMSVDLADGTTVIAHYRGPYEIGVGGRINVTFKAYLIPLLELNSVSCSRLNDYGYTTIFEREGCII